MLKQKKMQTNFCSSVELRMIIWLHVQSHWHARHLVCSYKSWVCMHLHAPVHISLDFRHLHLKFLQPVLYEHDTTSRQLSGIAGRDISVGTSCPSISVQPCVVGSGKFGCTNLPCVKLGGITAPFSVSMFLMVFYARALSICRMES